MQLQYAAMHGAQFLVKMALLSCDSSWFIGQLIGFRLSSLAACSPFLEDGNQGHRAACGRSSFVSQDSQASGRQASRHCRWVNVQFCPIFRNISLSACTRTFAKPARIALPDRVVLDSDS